MNKAIVQKINLQLHSDDGDINKYKCANAPNPAFVLCVFQALINGFGLCLFQNFFFIHINHLTELCQVFLSFVSCYCKVYLSRIICNSPAKRSKLLLIKNISRDKKFYLGLFLYQRFYAFNNADYVVFDYESNIAVLYAFVFDD